MKMKLLGVVAAALLALTTSAQQIKAGVNLANVSITDGGRVNEAKMLPSFHVGFVGDVPLAEAISLQPGVLFTGKGSKTEAGNPERGSYFKATTNPYYIEVLVNLVLKAPLSGESHFFVGAGPYLAMGIGGKNKVEGRNFLGASFSSESSIDFSNDDPGTLSEEEGAGFGIMRRFDYGLNGMAGIEGKAVVLGVNYGLGLAKLQSGANSGDNNNNKHRVLSFSIGFKL